MRRGSKVLLRISLLVACILSVSFSALVQAQDAPAPPGQKVILGLFPSGGEDGDRFEFTVEPGQSAEMNATLVSFGEEPIRLRSYPSHIIPIVNGGLQIPSFGVEPEGTVTWLDYPTEELILNPQEPVERTLKVTVPEGTPPGQYVNAIALETLDPITAEGSPFEQFYRKVVSVYVTVPGDVAVDFQIDDPQVIVNGGQSAIQFFVENTGNTRIDLVGSVSLSDASGTVVFEGDMILGPVYMGQITTVQAPMSSVPAPGVGYEISYSFEDRETGAAQSSDAVAIEVPEDESGRSGDSIQFENVSIEPNAEDIAFANVSVDVVISQSAQRSSRLTLSVYHNGEFVEDFVLADNLSLPIGSTTVSQRYIPATSWESGTYSFSLKLESVNTGQQELLLEKQDVATIEVP